MLEPDSSRGWHYYVFQKYSVWFCGHLYNHKDARAALANWPVLGSSDDVARYLNGLDGHYALICEMQGRIVAAVDPIRSLPIFFARYQGTTWIAEDPERLLVCARLDDVDSESALALAMSGYTIGVRTLFRGLEQLGPGEFFFADAGGTPRRLRYHRYSPWLVQDDDDAVYEKRLGDITLALTERMVNQADGRTIAVPLSAGRDSRLLVSALAQVGARNVVCFAYGLAGNYEAEASQKIANYLGFEWHFAPFSIASQRRFWWSEGNARYQKFADSCCSTTVVHDLPAVQDLLDRGVIDRRTIIVNGNSGDFISGLHIQPPVSQGLPDISHERRIGIIVATMVKKHFRLWQGLATPENDETIASQLRCELEQLGLGEVAVEQAHGLYEYLEFQDRQSKYVVSRQRIYDFIGLEWRLPLWSRDYLDFWQSVPLRLKRGQILYARMLDNRNWGGVWKGNDWKFARRVSPDWIRWIVRPLAMAACAPFGRSAWHSFERKFLSYWTDLLAFQSIEPYRRIVMDRRGARHLVAWHTEAYLQRKGLGWDGQSRCR